MYRYVWFYKEGDEKLLLAKSSLLYSNKDQCLMQGEKYPLSLDLPDHGGQLLLEAEVCFVSQRSDGITIEARSRLVPEQLSLCRSFQQDGKLILQLPYCVESKLGNKLYVYTIYGQDIWFYSTLCTMHKAYCDYLHS